LLCHLRILAKYSDALGIFSFILQAAGYFAEEQMGTAQFLSCTLLLLVVHYGTCLLPSSDNSFGTKNPPQESSSANSEFAILLTSALGSPGLKNTFFSPYSISSAMGMVYAGASGRTATEIANTFKFGTKNDVQLTYQGYYNAINAHDKQYSLSTANGLFVQSGFTLLQSYKDALSAYFHAAAKELDFIQQSEPSRQEINRWVESQTQNMIKDLFQSGTISPDTRLVLANAIYFKGTWKTLFPATATKSELFKTSETDVGASVPMMNVVSKFNIKRLGDLDAKVIQLPYSGDELSMLIFLPNEYDGLPKLLNGLKPSHFTTEGMRNMKVNVKLPRFKLETEINLKDVLQSMGIIQLFSNSADLSDMDACDGLMVTNARHKAVIEVDEDGTVASGLTASVISTRTPFSLSVFTADHPFAFVIEDTRQNLLLFFGTYTGNDEQRKDDRIYWP
jgi:serine protease inhibitor